MPSSRAKGQHLIRTVIGDGWRALLTVLGEVAPTDAESGEFESVHRGEMALTALGSNGIENVHVLNVAYPVRIQSAAIDESR